MRELQKYKCENLLFYDIETAPLVERLEPDTPLYDSWEYKKNKDGEMTQDEVIESYSKESGLYPEFAKVICIVAGVIQDDNILLITIDDEDEVELLNKFNALVERNSGKTLTGFVNIGFDTPFVFKRMVLNNIIPHSKLDSSGLKPWEVEELDLSKTWQGTSFNRASLINITTAFGLPSPKDDISGADVGRVYWNEQNGLKRISAYCRRDVVSTINIYRKMRFLEPLEVGNASIEDQPLILKLFGGGSYGAKEKKELESLFKAMSPKQRDLGYTILYSIVSTAKGKKTNIKKADVTALKKKLS